jgi:hypothetical protein
MYEYSVTLRLSNGVVTTTTIHADSLFLAQQLAKDMYSDSTILRVVQNY